MPQRPRHHRPDVLHQSPAVLPRQETYKVNHQGLHQGAEAEEVDERERGGAGDIFSQFRPHYQTVCAFVRPNRNDFMVGLNPPTSDFALFWPDTLTKTHQLLRLLGEPKLHNWVALSTDGDTKASQALRIHGFHRAAHAL